MLGKNGQTKNATLIKGDLLSQKVDAIVNAWNRNIIPWWLLLPQGVSGAIRKRAGIKPFTELPWRPIPLGQAVVTSAGKLPYKAIIHVAGINLIWRASERSVYDSVVNAIKLAEQCGFSSLAFPIIGSGSGGFKKEAAIEIMQDACNSIETSLQLVIVEYDS